MRRILLLVLLGVLLTLALRPDSEPRVCYTDSECSAMFGGDGGPEVR